MRDDFVNHLDPACGTYAARSTLAAAFDCAELHGEASLPGEIHSVVENHDPTVAEQALLRGKGLVVERRIKQGFREISTQRSAHLYRAERAPGKSAAAEIINRLRAA